MKLRMNLLLCLLLCLPAAWARADEDEPKGSGEEAVEAKADDAAATTDKAKEKEKEKDPVLRLAELELDHNVVPARMLNIAFAGRTRTLQDVLEKFEQWKDNEKIGAVLLNVTNMNMSLPDIEELREGLEAFKKGGKKVFVYFNGAGPTSYLLACLADEICIAPTGSIVLPGLGRIFPYLQGHYQMLGVEFDVITAGRYKYPGFLNRRESDQYFREEMGALLDSWFNDYVDIVAKGRDLEPDRVREIIDHAIFDADDAIQHGLADQIAYLDEYRDRSLRKHKMKKFVDGETDWSQINSIQDVLQMLNEAWQKEKAAREAVGPKIAVIHARGPIIDVSLGSSFSSMLICRDDFIKVVQEVRRNKSIKGVVLRIDSPGGSGYASDAIWNELRLLDEEKPLVVSQGTVAGSGGYYLSLPGRLIFSQPTTITGSIGVLGIFQSSWSAINRMDYNLEEMRRGERSLLGSPARPLPAKDREFIQKYMNDFYDIFLDRVARCRKMPRERVKEIAEGRIYSGRDALAIGLVDRLGGLDDAIAAVREMANIPASAKLRVVHFPRSASLGELFTSGLGGMGGADLASVLDLVRRIDAPARPVTFKQQVELFSQVVQPLCWMPLPELQNVWSGDIASFGTGADGWSTLSADHVKKVLGTP